MIKINDKKTRGSLNACCLVKEANPKRPSIQHSVKDQWLPVPWGGWEGGMYEWDTGDFGGYETILHDTVMVDR